MDDPTCYWTYDTWDGFYASSCGQDFVFNYTRSDDPEFAYCPYCGQEIIWIEHEEAE